MDVELPNPCAVNILKKEPAAASPRGLYTIQAIALLSDASPLMEKYNRKKLLVNNKAKLKQQDPKVLLYAPGGCPRIDYPAAVAVNWSENFCFFVK